jgi:NAD(P)-dependent dehydrogenase (short-subunit alcohol dehydrogenase family)
VGRDGRDGVQLDQSRARHRSISFMRLSRIEPIVSAMPERMMASRRHDMAKAIQEDLTGKVAIVTGATGGIGKELARGLGRLGATLIVGARDTTKAAGVVADLKKDARYPDRVTAMKVDVSNMASVRSFAREVGQKHEAVHILVNNAGAWFTDRRVTSEGHELTFATNVLGPYLLTKLLTAQLRAAKGARVVNVVSELAANYDSKDLEFEKRAFDGFKCYGQSKQALRMVTWLHADQLGKDRITVNAAAPGFVKTDFNQNAKDFVAGMIGFFSSFMAVSPAEGADTPLWAAASSEVAGQTAKYFDKRTEKDGKFRDVAALAELDRLCEAMTRDDAPAASTASA